MENVYFDGFDNRAHMEQQFEETLSEGIEVLFASYASGGYDGNDAFVLFTENGKLYEVNASHCSCYGLEGQWQPELTTVKSLRYTMEHGYKFSYHDKASIEDVIQRLERGEIQVEA